MANNNCFANGKECKILIEKKCEGCNFYKSKEQFKEELIKYNGTDNLKTILGRYARKQRGY